MRFFADILHFISKYSRQIFEPLFYGFGIHLYAGAIRFASLWNHKAGLMISGHKEIWTKLENVIDKKSKYIWVHAASLGEFEQGRPLIEKLRREKPEYKIVLTFFSPSGYEVRKNYKEADLVIYLPFDTRKNARKFLYAVNPEMVIFVKYEFWRNYLIETSRRNIPSYLISAVFRKEQLFFKRYGGWYRRLLHHFNHIFVQDEDSRNLLHNIGIERTTVAGDTRFDRVTDVMHQTSVKIPWAEENNFILVVGSSWEKDEEIYTDWINSHPQTKAIIAPHEFDNDRLLKLQNRLTQPSVRFSELSKNSNNNDVTKTQTLIIDCFGLLSQLYRYASVAYIGGGFGAGIHNINEAAVYGKPVIFGPKHYKFIEAREVIDAKGGFSVTSEEDFNSIMDKIYTDSEFRLRSGENAGNYIKSKLGATEKIYTNIFK